MNKETLMALAISVGLPVILALIARIFPKQKALDIVGKPARKLGKAISALGNSKLGAKAMDKIEEGPISTITAMLIHAVKEFEAGMKKDNVKRNMSKKVPKDIQKAFDRAVKK